MQTPTQRYCSSCWFSMMALAVAVQLDLKGGVLLPALGDSGQNARTVGFVGT